MAADAGPTLFTVGHGTLAADALTTLLRGAGIESVVDVRTAPGSRRHPQFGRDELEQWLPEAGLAYRWERRLGGFRRADPDSPHTALRHPSFRGYADHMGTREFTEALHGVLVEAASDPVTVMCSETLWWRCHRRLIADTVVLVHGWRVLHLGHDGRLSDHRPTEGVRLGGGALVYDAGQAPLV
jgi:uncharacterized protein (DUF488 family)